MTEHSGQHHSSIDPTSEIGNEVDAGTTQHHHRLETGHHQLVRTYEVLRSRRVWLDDLRMGWLAETAQVARDNRALQVVGNTVGLVAVLEAVAIGAPNYLGWTFLAYGLFVLLRRIDSRTVFGAALFALVLIPVVSLFNRQAVADDFAEMVFYFLLIGLVRAGFELRQTIKS